MRDEVVDNRVTAREIVHEGMVWDVVRDTVDLGEHGVVRREYVRHPGAVTVLPLDPDGRVLVLRQYRHPVGRALWELPAGLLDVDGENPLDAARRELAEEADLTAATWHVLADWFNSPGGSSESLRLYLARDLAAVAEADLHTREQEEAGIQGRWVDLDEARDHVLSGQWHNAGLVVGVLAAWSARSLGWDTLRPADSPWPEAPPPRP